MSYSDFTMDKLVHLNNQAAGRDKVARLIQYSSRALWDALEKTNSSPSLVHQFKTIEYILSTFRKLLRFGKCIDVFYSSLKTIHQQDIFLRITLTCSKLSQALFLVGDHFIWLSRTGLFKNIDSKKWGNLSNRYWLLSIVMNLARDVYEIFKLIDLHKSANKIGLLNNKFPQIKSTRDFEKLALYSFSLLRGHKDVVVDTVKNVCDVFIPLTSLGYVKLSPMTIGVLGTVSSIAGLLALIQPEAKLVPS